MDEINVLSFLMTDEELQGLKDRLGPMFEDPAIKELFKIDFEEEFELLCWKAQSESSINIIDLSRDPTKHGYEIGAAINIYDASADYLEMGCKSYMHWCKKNSFPTETISEYLRVYYELTVRRGIPLQVYQRLSPAQVDALIKPFLPDEPKVPAIAALMSDIPPEFYKWKEWAEELYACLMRG